MFNRTAIRVIAQSSKTKNKAAAAKALLAQEVETNKAIAAKNSWQQKFVWLVMATKTTHFITS